MMGAMIAGLAAPGIALAQAKPRIGFIGAGRLGGTVAGLWTEAGYQVMLSARDLGPVKELAGQLGPNAQVGTPGAGRGLWAMWWWSKSPWVPCRRAAAGWPRFLCRPAQGKNRARHLQS